LLLLEPAQVGGLVLARVLQLYGVTMSVDREPTSAFRVPGPRTSCFPNLGIMHWRAELIAQLRKITLPEGQRVEMMDKDGTVVFEDLPPHTSEGLASQDEQRPPPWRPSRGVPELDCGQLRQLLLASLQPGTVHWEHKSRIRPFLPMTTPRSHPYSCVHRPLPPSPPSNSSSSSVRMARGRARAGC
jgi:hypothetical protein